MNRKQRLAAARDVSRKAHLSGISVVHERDLLLAILDALLAIQEGVR